MSLQRIALCLVVGWMCLDSHLAWAQPATLEGAKWIWSVPGQGQEINSMPAGSAFLRGRLVLPEGAVVKSAFLYATADNLYAFYLNGRFVGQSELDPNLWNQPKRFDLAGLVKGGSNVLAVEAINTAAGPAGFILKLVVQLGDGATVTLVSDGQWRCASKAGKGWTESDFDEKGWLKAPIIAEFGGGPWGLVGGDLSRLPALKPSTSKGPALNWQMPAGAAIATGALEDPPENFAWPEGIVFLGEDCTPHHFPMVFHVHGIARFYPEHDIPGPSLMGRKLYALQPARPGVEPRLLADAGEGAIGSPSVSFDGKSILVAMAKDKEDFFHIYRVPATGGPAQRLTAGTFHDVDPCELPDGRIVFTSTRIGTFEEYHAAPSRSLFVMNADGSNIQPLTVTPIADNEPKIASDGRIVFVRSDNFIGRGKVETQIHAIRPDGTAGVTEAGADIGADYGVRLRALGYGCPSPLPDGQLAFLSQHGNRVGLPGNHEANHRLLPPNLIDLNPAPDGRLLGTILTNVVQDQRVVGRACGTLVVIDPGARAMVKLYESPRGTIHSPVFLGPRPRPAMPSDHVQVNEGEGARTGFLFCQDAFHTRKTKADWRRVKSVRVLGGVPLTTRSSHSYVVHSGIEAVELGTVPLAPDGSFLVEVPANMPLALQMVDAEGRSELNEMSWIYVRPGEKRSCVGCHHRRQSAPAQRPGGAPLAGRTEPLRLLGQGEAHRFRANNSGVTGMMDLQMERFRECASLDLHAHRPRKAGDAAGGWAREVARLIAQLGAGPAEAKIAAAQRLGIFRDRSAAPALAEALRDPAREVRVAAALALSACGTRESVQPLLAALGEADPVVFQALAAALENLTAHAEPPASFAEPRLRHEQAEKWRAYFRTTAWDTIEQQLIRQAGEGDRVAQRAAIVALGHVGGDAARAFLRDWVMRDPDKYKTPPWNGGNRIDHYTYPADSPLNPRTIQEAIRALGYLKDAAAVPVLSELIARHCQTVTTAQTFTGSQVINPPVVMNLYIVEAALEALGRIATPQAQAVVADAFAKFGDYYLYVGWYSDHPALYACHSSPIHHRALEALDAMAAKVSADVAAKAIRSMPTDPDRALFLDSDACETMIGRVVQHAGLTTAAVETCLSILGDKEAQADAALKPHIAFCPWAWAGTLDPECRAAQVLSALCVEGGYEPRIRAALDRYRSDRPKEIRRTLSAPGPMPKRNWVSFFLARTLARLGDARSVPALMACLTQEPPESFWGRPRPTEPIIHYLHNEYVPCFRAGAAFALGRIGDKQALPVLLKVVGDFENAVDTRHAAAVALGRLADKSNLPAIQALAKEYPEISVRRALLQACQRAAGQTPLTPLD